MRLAGGPAALLSARPRTRSRWRSPALGVQVVAALAWLMYAVAVASATAPATGAGASIWWCMPGMAVGRAASSDLLVTVLAGIPMWLVMVLAMSLPAAIPAIQHVAVNSFRRRQWRAVAEFLAVYLGLWVAFGVVAMAGFALLPSASPYLLLALVLTLAAAWELAPPKRLALNRCHRTSPLAPRGLRATAAVLRFGWINGSACIGSCWLTMVAMLAAPSARLGWALGLMGLTAYTKLTRRPRRAARRTAAILGAAAVGVLLGVLVR